MMRQKQEVLFYWHTFCSCFVWWNRMNISCGRALVVQHRTENRLGGCRIFLQCFELFILPNWGLQYLVALRTRLLDDRLVAWCCQERTASIRQAMEGCLDWIKTKTLAAFRTMKLSHVQLFHLFRLGNSCIKGLFNLILQLDLFICSFVTLFET